MAELVFLELAERSRMDSAAAAASVAAAVKAALVAKNSAENSNEEETFAEDLKVEDSAVM
jgi:DNA-binding ferritin-like protein